MRGKGSYFYRFFLNFIGMMMVPLITILLIFWQADRTVKCQIFESATKSLERYSGLFDVTVKEDRADEIYLYQVDFFKDRTFRFGEFPAVRNLSSELRQERRGRRRLRKSI